jgi:hypothetical protein
MTNPFSTTLVNLTREASLPRKSALFIVAEILNYIALSATKVNRKLGRMGPKSNTDLKLDKTG